jgi:hypothetical protein
MCKQSVEAYSKYYTGICPESQMDTTINLSQGGRCLSRDSKRVQPEIQAHSVNPPSHISSIQETSSSQTQTSNIICNFSPRYDLLLPITVAARSKAWTVFARSNAGIVGSNHTQGIHVYVRLFCVCVLCLGRGLATSWSPVQGNLPTEKSVKAEQRAVEP